MPSPSESKGENVINSENGGEVMNLAASGTQGVSLRIPTEATILFLASIARPWF